MTPPAPARSKPTDLKKDAAARRRRQESVDAVFRALSSDVRRDILMMLHYEGGPVTSSRIAEEFDVSWQAICRHLRVLSDAHLVSREVVGRDHYYTLEREHIEEVAGGWITNVARRGTRLRRDIVVYLDGD
jgi:DNA-binding transcriptional ArsR family regulator